MAIIKCDKGHFYDNEKYESCPHCQGSTVSNTNEDEKTIAKISSDNAKKNLAAFVAGKDERTISIFSSKGLQAPVIGWLVCTEGNEKGRDYRIKSGRNFVGRAHQNDIVISDDQGISRDNHFSLVFDPKSISYSVVPGSGVVFKNGVKVLEPCKIEAYDKLTVGASTLQFVPFCKEGVVW